MQELTLFEVVERYRAYQIMTVKASTYVRNYHQCNSIMKILGKDVLVNHLTANYLKYYSFYFLRGISSICTRESYGFELSDTLLY